MKTSQALVDIFKSLGHHADSTSKYLKMKTLGRDKHTTSNMHHKFGVFDNVVSFGSVNYTYQAFNYNYENVHFTSEDYLVGNFRNKFDEMWEIGKDFFIQGGKIRSLECPNCKKTDGVDFESYGAICINCFHKFGITDS